MTIMNDNDIKLQKGYERYYKCLNNSGNDIPKDTRVYFIGICDGYPTISEYPLSLNSNVFDGILNNDIKNNELGLVMVEGKEIDLLEYKTYTL